MAGRKVDAEKAVEVQAAVETLVKQHGFEPVRRVWNRYANGMKEREKLEQQRRDAEERLKELDAKIRRKGGGQ